jgi:chorismate--pyruvate lyase
MAGVMAEPASGAAVAAGHGWLSLDECLARAPRELHAWLAEPGLLTARVRCACDEAQFRLARLERDAVPPAIAARLGVSDRTGLIREIEFACGSTRWVFAQSVFPDSTLAQHAWLAELGGSALGESLLGRHDVSREPLEYRELAAQDALARAAAHGGEGAVWARRAVYHISDSPILVQEVFLPGLLHDIRRAGRQEEHG